MSDTFLDLYNQFMVYVNNDDEAGARAFLTENLTKFPEEVQEKITFAFFEEALLNKSEEIKGIGEMQKEGLEAMSEIEKAKKAIEDEIKIRDLRSDLTK